MATFKCRKGNFRKPSQKRAREPLRRGGLRGTYSIAKPRGGVRVGVRELPTKTGWLWRNRVNSEDGKAQTGKACRADLLWGAQGKASVATTAFAVSRFQLYVLRRCSR